MKSNFLKSILLLTTKQKLRKNGLCKTGILQPAVKIISCLVLSCLLLFSMTQSMAQTVVTITASGSWTVPANVYSLTVESWGGGGGGGGAYGNHGMDHCAAGGGGGGAYAKQIILVMPGQVYTVTIGAGGSGGTSFPSNDGNGGGTTTFTGIAGACSAAGGSGGEVAAGSPSGSGGAGGSSGTGFLFKGGNGAAGNGNGAYGGGGGGSAGSGSDGSNGGSNNNGGTGGTGTYPGGNGGNGGINYTNGSNGTVPGGGGGGAANNNSGSNGGSGSRGQINVTYTVCSLTISNQPASPPVVCAGGGTATFTINVSGGTSYQWQEYNNSSWANITNGGFYSNATTPTLTVTNPTYAMNGYKYRCIVNCIHSDGNAKLTVYNVLDASITANGSTTFCSGESVTLTSSAGTSYLWSTGATTQSIVVTTSGSYTVTVKDGNGCSAVSPATDVTVIGNPNPFINPGGTETINAGGSAVLTSNYTSGNQWSTGETTQTITVSTSGAYTVTVTNNYGCSATSLATTVIVNGTPTITSFAPTTGPVGTTVTISGTNFDTNPANDIVFFGAAMATVTAASATSLMVTVPAGATYQNISVSKLYTGLTAYTSKPFITTFACGGTIDPGSFAPKTDFATVANNNYSIAIGDLNGDGKPDIAVTNGFDYTISVFRNTSTSGTISFDVPVNYAAGSYPNSVSIGDLDGDGKPDLVVTNYYTSSISVFRNTGAGGTISFDAKVDFPTADYPNGVSIGDLDVDGKPDIVVVNNSNYTISILKNISTAGTISFASRKDYWTAAPGNVAIGDLDGDGKPDLVVSNQYDNFASVFQNISTSGGITFAAQTQFTIGSGIYWVAIGDLDGDGKPDLAAASYYDNTVSVCKNTSTPGSISFAANVSFATGANPVCLSISDLDGDGKPDLAVDNYDNTVSVFKNICTPGTVAFATKVDFATGDGQICNSICDLDGDGKPDLATANYNSGTFSTIRNTISGGASPVITGTTPGYICVPGIAILGATADRGIINWYAAPTGGPSLGTGPIWITPVIYVLATYYVDATDNGCTTASRTAITAKVIPFPPAPINITPTANLSISSGQSTTLFASGIGTLGWYSAATGGNYLGGGANFTTPVLNTNTTYYVQDNICGASAARTAITVITECRVNIPDANFKAALIALGVDLNSDGFIQCSEAAAFTGYIIDVNNQGISDLTGIEAFPNITILNCSYNSLTSLNVSSNTALNFLICNNNLLQSLDVSSLTALYQLDCSYNQLTDLDVSSNIALKLFFCGNNLLTDLDVSSNIALTDFGCESNALLGLNVSSNTALTFLACNFNSLTSLDVSSNTALNFLSCGNNSLTSLNVSSNASLMALGCEFNSLTSLDVSSNTALMMLSCTNNLLSGLDVSGLASLLELSCSSNQLTTLDVSSNTVLALVYCSGNALTGLNVKNGNNTNFFDFDATNNPGLSCIQVDDAGWSTANWTNKDAGASFNTDCTPCIVNIPDANFKAALIALGVDLNSDGFIQCSEAAAFTGTLWVNSNSISDLTGIEAFINIPILVCNNNSLTSLNVSGLTSLTEIDCHNNQLTTLNVSSNIALQYLYCNNNSLTSLNVSGLTSLIEIDCYYNQLTSLDVSSNTALHVLVCYNNSLTSLITTGLTSLSDLECGYNLLTTMNVSSNTALQYLYCNNNSLTSLNVSSLISLNGIRCYYNQLSSLNVSSNTAIDQLECNNNSLTSLNVKNGNNAIITSFNAIGNPGLSCIQVDNADWSTANWSNIDATAGFNTDCSCHSPIVPTNTTPAANQTICSGNTTYLSAGGTGTLGWYSAASGGTWLGGGANYTTPILNANTAFYVQDSTCEASTTRTIIAVTVNTSPVISCSSDMTVDALAGQCGAIVNYQAATANGTPSPTISYSQASGSFFPVGNTIVTATASNLCGTAPCSFTITIHDNQPPVITCPGNINVDATSAAGAVVTYVTPVGSDNCQGSVTTITSGLASGSAFPIGVTNISYTIVDGAGHSSTCSFTVTVTGLAPQIICPANITVNNAPGQCGNSVNFSATETTGIPASVITYSVEPGSFFNVGTSTVNATATNAVGTSTCNFNVTVNDVTPPVINCPAAVNVQCASEVPSPDISSVIATDNCPVAINIIWGGDVINGMICPNKYIISRTYTATDLAGNSSSCTQTIIVNDETAPLISGVGPTLTIECPAVPVFAAATATDICGSLFTLTYADVTTNHCGASYSLTRTWTAMDACGNVSTASQTINVEDHTAPVIAALPAISTIQCPAAPVFAVATAMDACGSSFTLTYADVTTNHCGASYSVTRTWTATDACGNVSTASQTINVEDHTAPVIAALPAISTIQCPAAPVFAVANAMDACGSSFTLTYADVTTNHCGASYSLTRTWTAMDACGNVSTASQTINVEDHTAPVIVTPAASLNPPHLAGTISTWLNNHGGAVAFDACGTITWSNNFQNYNTCSTASFPVTFKATDQCGNSATTTASIIQPNLLTATIATLPVFNLYPTCAFSNGANIVKGFINSVQFNAAITGGTQAYTYSWYPTTGLSNANVLNPVFNPVMAQGTCAVFYFALIVTDAYGCVATAELQVNAINPQTPGTTPGSKYTICHNNHDINVSVNAIPAQLGNGQGNCLGSCAQLNGNGCTPVRAFEVIAGNNPSEDIYVSNYPNPFSNKTTIQFVLPTDNKVRIEIYDMTGKLIEMLFNQDVKMGEEYLVEFDGTSHVDGIYLYKITSNSNLFTGKMILNKQ